MSTVTVPVRCYWAQTTNVVGNGQINQMTRAFRGQPRAKLVTIQYNGIKQGRVCLLCRVLTAVGLRWRRIGLNGVKQIRTIAYEYTSIYVYVPVPDLGRRASQS